MLAFQIKPGIWDNHCIPAANATTAPSTGTLEIHLLKYTNKYGRSNGGSRCPKDTNSQEQYRCTNIFKLRLSSGTFSESITTMAFQEAVYAKTVNFRVRLNDKISNPWKIKLPKIEVCYIPHFSNHSWLLWYWQHQAFSRFLFNEAI